MRSAMGAELIDDTSRRGFRQIVQGVSPDLADVVCQIESADSVCGIVQCLTSGAGPASRFARENLPARGPHGPAPSENGGACPSLLADQEIRRPPALGRTHP